MAPFPQKSVFSAEINLGRSNGHAVNGHGLNGHGLNASAKGAESDATLSSGDVEALRAEIRALSTKIDGLSGVSVAAPDTVDGDITSAEQQALDRVKAEVEAIAARITLTKQEIANLKHPLAKEDKLQSASMELSAVVKATEEATSAIMSVAEHLEEIAREVTTQVTDAYVVSRLNEMTDQITKLFEACSFQDLTGQRITKVVKTIDYIEERIETMQVIWGRKDLSKLPVPDDGIIKKDGDLELHGPQAVEQAISQDDIDKLFN
jgi:chemotaxis protein CheZ